MNLTTLKIKRITKLQQKVRVYDLSVDETHNFFVGRKQILTSNCDGMTFDAQKILRSVMEEYAANTRFILTCNYLHKVIAPIQSRCQIITLDPPIEGIVQKVKQILQKENITISENQKPLLLDHIRKHLPDIRRIVNDIQKF
jgi:replication factor C small subunit